MPAAKRHLARVDAVPLGGEGDEARLDPARRVLRCLAVEVAARRRRRRRRVGDLLRVGRGDAHRADVDAELVGDDLRDLGVQALAHLGAAVVDEHRAVAVDVDERAGLVEMDEVERDAELDRREGDAALEHRALRVPGGDLGAALAVARRRLELGDQLDDDVVVDDLAVGRDVALARRARPRARPVEVDAADVERILAELRARSCRGCSRPRSRPAARRSRGTRCCSACSCGPSSRGWRRRAASRRCRSGRSPASSPGRRDRPRSRRARPSSARRRGSCRRRRSRPRTRSGSSGAGR